MYEAPPGLAKGEQCIVLQYNICVTNSFGGKRIFKAPKY